jgi:hypothetical protein
MATLRWREGTFSSAAVRRFQLIAACALVLCCALFLAFSWRWPLVGDIASIHYLVLLMQDGMAPYREIVDPQMPGTYLLEGAAMHVFGWGALGARFYDWSILLLAAIAMFAIARPYSRFAALFAAAMLAIVHGRDGLEQTAERDLTMAALLLAASAFAFAAARRRRSWLALPAALCASAATTLKPTVLPFGLVLLLLLCLRARRIALSPARVLLFGLLGFLLPPAACLAFLLRERALPQFLAAVHGMWPYYATLARMPFAELLPRSISPLLPLVVIWLLLLIFTRAAARSWEYLALWAGVLMGLLSYLWQGKGFPYHRYPLLSFLLLLMAIDFSSALRRSGPLRYLGAAGILGGALVIAPISTWKLSRFDWRDQGSIAPLCAELQHLGGPALAGRVQCLDAFAGCINALYLLRLPQSTGFLVDFYFWAQPQNAVTEEMRDRFWNDIQRHPPAVFVVSKQLYPGPDTYAKLQRWPQFYSYLASNYTLVDQYQPQSPVLWTSHPAWPAGFRVYLRNQAPSLR